MNQLYRKVTLAATGTEVGTGWLPPMPDLRDYTDKVPEIAKMSKKLGLSTGQKKMKALPPEVDLRAWCSPVEDQKKLGSCTANAAVGVVEYFQNRAFGKYIDGSRLFVYKATRNLMGVTGDTGAWLRNAMGALALCGVPAEKYWPYTDAAPDFDREPPSFVYAVADNFEALRYFCHDPMGAGISGEAVLNKVKAYLAAGIPSMFGFFGFSSFEATNVPGGIPYPCPGEQSQWGHAIVAVGYDDGKKIKNTRCGTSTTGALLIRNSWGASWGDNGYGWLPYKYVTSKLAQDFWSILSMKWVDSKQFGL
ncbi:MAG TPA: cysteine protease [Desulfobulbus sp.]|nr:cysteine protease [Desulfobulbus sp.]